MINYTKSYSLLYPVIDDIKRSSKNDNLGIMYNVGPITYKITMQQFNGSIFF